MITAANQNLGSALIDRMKENYVISLVSHSRFYIRMAVEANMEETELLSVHSYKTDSKLQKFYLVLREAI